jgi:hypothetical protein
MTRSTTRTFDPLDGGSTEPDDGLPEDTTQAEGLPEAEEQEPPEAVVEELKPGWATEGETAEGKETRENAVRAAYSKATTSLREEQRTRFHELVKAFAAEAGYEWRPQQTKAEKAAAEIERLIAENPDLAEVYGKFADH